MGCDGGRGKGDGGGEHVDVFCRCESLSWGEEGGGEGGSGEKEGEEEGCPGWRGHDDDGDVVAVIVEN